MYYLIVITARCPRSKYQKLWLSLRDMSKNLPRFCPHFCWFPDSLSIPLLVDASVWSPPLRSRAVLSVCMDTYISISKISPFHKDTSHLDSVQFSHSVMSDSLGPHEPQHARPPCPSPTPRVHPNSCPSSQWCHPTISSSVIPFSSCPKSFPASRSFGLDPL